MGQNLKPGNMEEAAIDIWASLETPSMIRCSVLGEAVGEKRIKKRKLGFKVKVVHGYKGTGLVVEEELFLGGRSGSVGEVECFAWLCVARKLPRVLAWW